ncbi:MAG: AcrR family transcriptional regulator [Cognaticolwellia sp.]|jgi:AcrR family transcriptional regulator
MTSTGRPRDPDVDARIVASTRELLDEQGAKAVTLAAVSRMAGVSRPTLYRRYPDADALLMAVLAADVRTLVATTDLSPTASPADHVMAQLEPFMAYYAAHPERSRALLRAATFADAGPASEINQLNADRIASLGAAIAASTELPDGTDPRQLGFMVYAVHLMTIIAGLHGLFPDPDQQRAALRSCVIWILRSETA